MKKGRLAFVTAVAIGAVVILLLLLGSASTTVTAGRAAVTGTSTEPPESRLFDETPVHYVTITGTDSGDCSTPVGACRTVQYAVDQAGYRDEIRIAAGRYSDLSVRPRHDVTTTGVVTQVAYISKTLAMRGGYTTTDCRVSPTPPVLHCSV